MPRTKRKITPASVGYERVREVMQRHFAIILTDEQIRQYSAMHPITKRDSPKGICDTMDRDLLIDAIVEDLLGADFGWPMNMDDDRYNEQFYPAFKRAAIEKGIRLDEKWKQV